MQINWLSILRGWVVILVIINHISPNVDASGGAMGILHELNVVFKFRMPLFFFISGFLLYYTKIRKDSPFGNIIKERIPRIICPYLFFTLAVFCVKLILSSYVKRPVTFSFSSILNIFLYPDTNPWEIFWFLNVVLIFFLLYPILKYSLKNKYFLLFTGFTCLGLNLFYPTDIYLLDLSTVARYLIFFYFGILFSKYELQKYLKGKQIGLELFAIFILSLFFDYNNLLHSFSGICISVHFALVCSEKMPNLFSSFRNYYYQIYLLGTFFQAAVLQMHTKIGNSYILLLAYCFFSALSGIYAPVIIGKIIRKLQWKPLMKVVGF
ncbi:hypothetical protein AGMMS50239_27930 [Bacteroidia bacterium]|nr:hypothetical protein AGMMS50239_27930 [Bacteroidia bacterium]